MESIAAYNVDSIPVSTLPDRYEIGRSALYNRINALGISVERRGKLSHVSASQLDQLDQLDTRLKAGEAMPTTIDDKSPGHLSTEHTLNKLTTTSPSTDSALLTIASMLQASINESRDLMRNYRALQSAADNGWLLPTNKVRELVGVKPHGNEYDRLGFRFVRCDRRAEWRVIKNQSINQLTPQNTTQHN